MKVKFRGQAKPCNSSEPHAAHIVGGYSTVAWGDLEEFCPGFGLERILVSAGDAYVPDHGGEPETPSGIARLARERAEDARKVGVVS